MTGSADVTRTMVRSGASIRTEPDRRSASAMTGRSGQTTFPSSFARLVMLDRIIGERRRQQRG